MTDEREPSAAQDVPTTPDGASTGASGDTGEQRSAEASRRRPALVPEPTGLSRTLRRLSAIRPSLPAQSKDRLPLSEVPPTRIDVRLGAAVVAAKVASAGIRRLGRGGGTATPGLIADRIDPDLLPKLASRLGRGVVVVAGTNGKTTTSRMLADILEADGARVVHNRSGSNLLRGVAAAFADQASPTGDPGGDVAVVETDEAAFPELVRRLRPRVVVLNNLFRDQLDRYGELETIAKSWRVALSSLPATAVVVVNADDPTLAAITEDLVAGRLAFGLEEQRHTLSALPHAVDAVTCRRCGVDLTYDALYSSHLGAWRCPNCGNARPSLDVAGRDLTLDGVEALAITIRLGRRGEPSTHDLRVEVGVPGLYNAYNAVAAVAAARALGVPNATIQGALKSYRAAFGRIERLTVAGRQLTLALIKNPVGCNEVLRMLTGGGPTAALSVPTMIAINDLAADGRDVSWLWDADFELLANGPAPLFAAGIRGADMANRLKYAGVPLERITLLPEEPGAALDAFVQALPPGGKGYILPTYTALLELRKILADRGAVETFWRQ
jgi:UDP-N-acetylmuramyl tripeptide synthase